MSIPCVRGEDPADCGPASLATVARLHGANVSLAAVRRLCAKDMSGTSLIGLKEAAFAVGFRAEAVRVHDHHALAAAALPLIAHVKVRATDPLEDEAERGHFLTVVSANDRGVQVSDPLSGPRHMTREEFWSCFTGAALLLEPTPLVLQIESGPPSYRRFGAVLAKHWKLLSMLGAASIAYVFLALGMSLYIRFLADKVVRSHKLDALHLAGVGFLAVVILRVVSMLGKRFLLVRLSLAIDSSLTIEYFQHVLRLPLSFFNTRGTGRILGRVADTHRIRAFIAGTVLSSAVDVLVAMVVSVVMFRLNHELALLLFLQAPLTILVVFLHSRPLREAERAKQQQLGSVQGFMVEVIAGARALKGACAEAAMAQKFARIYEASIQTAYGVSRLSLRADGLASLLYAAGQVGILWYGGFLAMERGMTIGTIFFFFVLLGYFMDPLNRLSSGIAEVQEALVASDRLADVFDVEPERARGEPARPEKLEGRIALENVRYRYGYRAWILDGVTLEIHPGETVALVGRSGCGKTTLAGLVARFHDATEGRVLIDGRDIRDLDVGWYRSRLAIVDQECTLFSTSVLENIRLKRPDATLDEVVELARLVGAHDFIEALPDGYDTLVGERGACLSGGQRQRITIARALLGRPDLLILDEATSQLDADAERMIEELVARGSGRTTLLITHRLSSTRRADRIYVIDAGKVAEHGTFQELMARDGLYAGMWRRQNAIRPERRERSPDAVLVSPTRVEG